MLCFGVPFCIVQKGPNEPMGPNGSWAQMGQLANGSKGFWAQLGQWGQMGPGPNGSQAQLSQWAQMGTRPHWAKCSWRIFCLNYTKLHPQHWRRIYVNLARYLTCHFHKRANMILIFVHTPPTAKSKTTQCVDIHF